MSEAILIKTFENAHTFVPVTTDNMSIDVEDENLVLEKVRGILARMRTRSDDAPGQITITIAPEVLVREPEVPEHHEFHARDDERKLAIHRSLRDVAEALKWFLPQEEELRTDVEKIPEGARILFYDYFDTSNNLGRSTPLSILHVGEEGISLADVALCARAVQTMAAKTCGRGSAKGLPKEFQPVPDPYAIMDRLGASPVQITEGCLDQHIEVSGFYAQVHQGTLSVQVQGGTWNERDHPRASRQA
jgi:hypothetical protein